MRLASGYRGILAGVVLSSCIVLCGVFAPLIAPHDPTGQNLGERLSGPNREYPLGTDRLGRCLASRLIYGARPSIGIALGATCATVLIGFAVGLPAALFPRLDMLLMRLTDCFFSLPAMVLALVIISMTGPGPWGILLALSLPGWPKYARVVRGTSRSQLALPQVEAVRCMGAGHWYVTRTCLLPWIWPQTATIATLGIGGKVAAIAGLGFLGLGVQPPTPEWGAIMVGGLPVLGMAPHISLFSGLAIAATVLGFTLLGEGLHKIINPFLSEVADEELLGQR
ncbi:MAG: ABC transporter permease [Desulfonatronovibrionaceae bacterium]